MRFWAYFCAKLAGAAGLLYALLILINRTFPSHPSSELSRLDFAGTTLLFDLALLGWFLLCAGAAYAVVWDQRYRCRVCLRRLRMPIATGSWSLMLQFGRPRIEYICPFGHGTLKEDELQISGLENPEWKQNSDDIWEELCAPGKDPGDPQ